MKNKIELYNDLVILLKTSKKGNEYISLEFKTKKGSIFKLPLRFNFENDSERYAYYRILKILKGE